MTTITQTWNGRTHDRPSLNLPVLFVHRPGSRLHPAPRDRHNRERFARAGDGADYGGILATVEIVSIGV